MKKVVKTSIRTGYTFGVVLVCALALLFVGTKVGFLGYEVKVVQSGSMEPAILTGSLVVLAQQERYDVGDVITFGPDTPTQIPTTHRIVEAGSFGGVTEFLTQGDANDVIDPDIVRPADIIGKVAFSIPYLGFLIEFLRTPLGFVLLIGLPSIVIVLDEFANIMWEIHKYRFRKRQGKVGYRTPSRERQPREQARPPVPMPRQHRPGVRSTPVTTKRPYVLDLRAYKQIHRPS